MFRRSSSTSNKRRLGADSKLRNASTRFSHSAGSCSPRSTIPAGSPPMSWCPRIAIRSDTATRTTISRRLQKNALDDLPGGVDLTGRLNLEAADESGGGGADILAGGRPPQQPNRLQKQAALEYVH